MEKDSSTIYERPLQKVDVFGTMFYADAINRELRQVDNPENRIKSREMIIMPDRLEMLFDKETKNIFKGNWNDTVDPSRADWIWIRPIEALDVEGSRYLQQKGMYQQEQFTSQDYPLVKLGRTDFLIDDKRNELRQKDNPWNSISFNEIIMIGDRKYLYFDERVKNTPFPHELDVFNPPEKLPGNITRIEVPDLLELKKKYELSRPQDKREAIAEKNNRKKRAIKRGF